MFGLTMFEFLLLCLTAVYAGAAFWTAAETRKVIQASVILQIRQQFDQLNVLDRNKAPKAFDLEAISLIDKDSNEADMYKEMVIKYDRDFYNVMCFIKTKTINKITVKNIFFL